MKKFHEFKVWLYSKKGEELGIEIEDIPGKVSIALNDVSAFRQASANETENVGDVQLTQTCVYLSSGESFIVSVPYEEFKKIMDEKS